MGDRRKRLNACKSCGADPANPVGVEFANTSATTSAAGGKQHSVSLPVDSSNFKCGSFASRCSVRLIHEVVSKFDSSKKGLVKSVGFEGILHFPVMKQINRNFSLWLMSCVDQRMATINIGDNIRISFNKYDVGHVFGIPFSGKTVLEDVVATRDAKLRVIQKYLGQEFNDKRSVKIVQEILEREYVEPMSQEEADRFRVAFIVFVVSNLLSPSAKYDYACVDYWNAIQDPDDISSYDWCGFVITRLLEAVTKLKQDIANNIKYPSISGCSLFLQVLYLDSLDLEGLSMDHNTLPRIRVFPSNNIGKFMTADKNFLRYCKGDDGRPVGKLRDVSCCIYSWALQMRDQPADSRSGCLLPIFEVAIAMVHLLNIPLEAAGPLFVAATDFQEQINAGQFVTGPLAIKFMSVLVSLMIPYTRGFRYQSPYPMSVQSNGNDFVWSAIKNGTRLLSFPIQNRGKNPYTIVNGECLNEGLRYQEHGMNTSSNSSIGCSSGISLMLDQTHIGDDAQRSIKCAIARNHEMPDYLNVNLCVATTLSRFYSALRKIKSPDDFDLNARGLCEIRSPSPSSVSRGVECDILPSPWEIGYAWSASDVDAEVLFGKLGTMEVSERPAIVHREPKYIQVSFRDMCAQFMGTCEMELDLFDALVRIARQEDDLLFGSYGHLRWRHFFESDFMAAILSGVVDVVNLTHLVVCWYAFCRFFFPALLHCKWVCFVWQPVKNLIWVFDPSYEVIVPDGRLQLIERTCYMLKLALKTLNESVFTGVCRDVSNADVFMLNIPDKSVARNNRSGVLCSMFYRCFDGCDLTSKSRKVDLDAVAAKLLCQIRNLKGNSGTFQSLIGDE